MMLQKVLHFGNKLVQEKIEDENSMLYRMIATTKDIEQSTKQIKKIFVALYVVLILGIIQQLFAVFFLRSSFLVAAPAIYLCGILISAAVFAYSTNFDYFNFWRRNAIFC